MRTFAASLAISAARLRRHRRVEAGKPPIALEVSADG